MLIKRLKSRKASSDITELLSIVIAVIVGAGVYIVISAESAFNADMLERLDNAMIIRAYANSIMTDSCILERNSLGQPMPFRLNKTYLDSISVAISPIPCIDFPNLEYDIDIFVGEHDLSTIPLLTYEFRKSTVIPPPKLKNPIVYYAVRSDGRPAIVNFTFLNVTE